ncbi:MAG TPA: VOC family protein [Nitrososphaera sp.]
MPRPIHFDITADDPKRAIKFYETAFGWKFQKMPIPGVGFFATCQDTEGNIFGIIQEDHNAK